MSSSYYQKNRKDEHVLPFYPGSGTFKTSGKCPSGYVEQNITHINWYGEKENSGWKWCTEKDVYFASMLKNEQKEPDKEKKYVKYTVRKIR